ncbi:ABC transporter ATP-binding protein [Actinopolymorpha pittospori]|uniref:Oligopeptide/dipeptide ABC transporter ATP-binding protein n=1 Tax=Actinopolymorpha pittospori TaxID=648752 RepID=A0A927N346_9ACTN|nr:ABC transporter ATP-binding protein [Actinopolymorpha pittospori]MBE1611204.1 oligopeptide/dipeptide ABC transporter ATP-binding protein [Actinopolymorpha pittospori]
MSTDLVTDPARERGAATAPLLSVRDLRTRFRNGREIVPAVDGVSFDLHAGRALAIVGESGSGKTVTARTLMRLLPRTATVAGGQVWFNREAARREEPGPGRAAAPSRRAGRRERARVVADQPGRDLLTLSEREMRRVRGRDIGMVFQNAMEAMNPTLTLERQLTEHLLWHGVCGKAEARERAVRALGDVGIPEPERRIRTYPFQLSGGMRQRAMIAMAMLTEPALLIADEPTTAVDVTVQRQILDLLVEVKSRGTGIVMITHDLGVARYFCDDVVVMYAGRVVERAPTHELLDAPKHPYAVGLLGSCVELGERHRPLVSIQGSPPDLARRPQGCAFHPRCGQAERPRCLTDQELLPISAGREAACWKAVTDGAER